MRCPGNRAVVGQKYVSSMRLSIIKIAAMTCICKTIKSETIASSIFVRLTATIVYLEVDCGLEIV
jgi:hypothetical protein